MKRVIGFFIDFQIVISIQPTYEKVNKKMTIFLKNND